MSQIHERLRKFRPNLKLALIGPNQQVVTVKEAVSKEGMAITFAIPYTSVEEDFKKAVEKALEDEMATLAGVCAEFFLNNTPEGQSIVESAQKMTERYPAMTFDQLNEAVSKTALEMFQKEGFQ